MSLTIRFASASALACLSVLGAAAPRADAQTKGSTPLFVPNIGNQAINPNFRIAPNLTLPQAAFNTSVFGQAISQVPAYALGFNPYSPFGGGGLGAGGLGGLGAGGLGGLGSASLASPYGAAGGYGGGYGSGYGGYGGYYEDPTAGYLRGVASVTNAQGQYLSQVQQARLQQSQADMSKLDLRRRIAEEAAFERKNRLTPEAERVRDLEAAYVRATREPPMSEILSGQALNDLYNHVYPIQASGKTMSPPVLGPNIPLDEDMLKQVNLVGAGSAGSIAMLKDRGKLTWPLVLQSPEYDKARMRLTTLAADAVDQVRLNNPVGAATLRDMMADVKRMNETLLRNVGEVSPSEYVEAKRYLNGLDSAIRALQDPNVGNQLNQNWAARASKMAELIDFMGQKGLKFAPATAGDEPAYRYIYQRLVAYDAAFSGKAANLKGSSASSKD